MERYNCEVLSEEMVPSDWVLEPEDLRRMNSQVAGDEVSGYYTSEAAPDSPDDPFRRIQREIIAQEKAKRRLFAERLDSAVSAMLPSNAQTPAYDRTTYIHSGGVRPHTPDLSARAPQRRMRSASNP